MALKASRSFAKASRQRGLLCKAPAGLLCGASFLDTIQVEGLLLGRVKSLDTENYFWSLAVISRLFFRNVLRTCIDGSFRHTTVTVSADIASGGNADVMWGNNTTAG